MDDGEKKIVQEILTHADLVSDLSKKLLGQIIAFDSLKMKWIKTKGEKGEFEKCSEPLNPEYNKAMTMLEYGGGSFTHQGFFYWLFNDKSAIGRKPSKPISQKTEPPATPLDLETRMRSIFTDELFSMLDFTEEEGFIKIKAKKFIYDQELFARIASVVRANGGEYVSAGKDSHFRIVKSKA